MVLHKLTNLIPGNTSCIKPIFMSLLQHVHSVCKCDYYTAVLIALFIGKNVLKHINMFYVLTDAIIKALL